jgi:small subunit ribosomal protein S20
VANSRSARKRIRANERKHVRNRAVRSAVRTKITKARRALVGIDDAGDGQEQLVLAVSALDKAAEKGILHRRNAARRKSRLMAMAHRLAIATEAGEDALAAARVKALGGEKGRKAAGGRRTAADATPATAAARTARGAARADQTAAAVAKPARARKA